MGDSSFAAFDGRSTTMAEFTGTSSSSGFEGGSNAAAWPQGPQQPQGGSSFSGGAQGALATWGNGPPMAHTAAGAYGSQPPQYPQQQHAEYQQPYHQPP